MEPTVLSLGRMRREIDVGGEKSARAIPLVPVREARGNDRTRNAHGAAYNERFALSWRPTAMQSSWPWGARWRLHCMRSCAATGPAGILRQERQEAVVAATSPGLITLAAGSSMGMPERSCLPLPLRIAKRKSTPVRSLKYFHEAGKNTT